MIREGTTIRVRGEGGAEWDQDVPEDGSLRREQLEELIAKGIVEVLDGDVPDDDPEAQVGEATDEPREGTEVPLGETGTLDATQVQGDSEGDDQGNAGDGEHPGDAADGPVMPGRNASKPAWIDYALTQGADPDTIGELTRDEIRDLYSTEGD